MLENHHKDIPVSGKRDVRRNVPNNKSYQHLANNQRQNKKRSESSNANSKNNSAPYSQNNDVFFSQNNSQNKMPSNRDVYFKRQNNDETVYIPNGDKLPSNQRPSRPSYNNLVNNSANDISFSKRGEMHSPSHYPQENEPVQRQRKSRKKGKLRRFFRNTLAIILVFYIAVTAYLYSVINDITYDNNSGRENSFVKSSSLASNLLIENILLIGVDQRADEASRSDTMILLSIDRKNRKIKLTSFLRDTYVTIPNNGSGRLNAACTYGGANLVIDTIEHNFKVKIDHYVYVNFSMFETIVNGIGGINVNITEHEAEYMRDTVKIPYIKSGENHLNGGAALWFCRIRTLDDDFHRTERQRQVISSIIRTATRTSPLKLISTVKSVLPNIKTDISPLRMTALIEGAGLFYIHFDIEQISVPFDGLWEDAVIDGQAVLSIDKEANVDKLHQYIYGNDE